ncbi:CRAL-TRIO domain-containing protein [Trichonephila clavipes]|nr:CRAL-TRIO domain-containing protein [Trichonephila clavipes]
MGVRYCIDVHWMCPFRDPMGSQFLFMDITTPLRTVVNSIPLRIKEIHIVNAHSVFRILYNTLHFIFPKDLREKLFFHPNDDWKSLHGFISPQILSEEFGGNIRKSTMINLLENAKELEKRFLESFSYGYVDTKKLRMSFRVITQ